MYIYVACNETISICTYVNIQHNRIPSNLTPKEFNFVSNTYVRCTLCTSIRLNSTKINRMYDDNSLFNQNSR